MLKAVVYIGGHLPHVPTPLPKHLFKKEVKLRRPGKKKNFGEKYNRVEQESLQCTCEQTMNNHLTVNDPKCWHRCMPVYSLPNLGESTKWCSSTESCSVIQYKYEHRWKSTGDKAYGVTSIQNRRKHLNNKYDVSKLIMSVLNNDTTVVTAEQEGGTNAEQEGGTNAEAANFMHKCHKMQCCKLEVPSVRPEITTYVTIHAST